MDLDRAVLCGLIVNELVSNALKHAFPDERTGRIAVELRATPEEQILLKVTDDGVGLPWGLNIRQTKTLGHQLVWMLTEKLRGTLEVTRDRGTAFCFVFPSKPPEEPPPLPGFPQTQPPQA
jgi:two-component sensor histidine kinase